MKDFTRRDFLKLSGASALALALAACGSSGSGAPSTATEAQIESVVNNYRKSKGLNELKHDDALAEYAKASAAVCKAHDTKYDDADSMLTEEELETLTAAELKLMEKGRFSDSTASGLLPISLFPESETELDAQLAAYDKYLSAKERYIGTTATTIKGKPYWLIFILGKKETDPA